MLASLIKLGLLTNLSNRTGIEYLKNLFDDVERSVSQNICLSS